MFDFQSQKLVKSAPDEWRIDSVIYSLAIDQRQYLIVVTNCQRLQVNAKIKLYRRSINRAAAIELSIFQLRELTSIINAHRLQHPPE